MAPKKITPVPPKKAGGIMGLLSKFTFIHLGMTRVILNPIIDAKGQEEDSRKARFRDR